MPKLVTAPEFLYVLREYFHTPVEWEELAALRELGVFRPRFSLFAGHRAEQEGKAVVEATLPVYETFSAGRFVRLWRTRFAVHVPVATTTVQELRTTWGRKLAAARRALGLRPGRQPDIPAMPDDPPFAGASTWREIARTLAPSLPPLTHSPTPEPEADDGKDDLSAFWESRAWTFSDGGEPVLLTMTEFASVIRDLFQIPVDRDELLILGNLGVFTPQHMLFVGRLLEKEDKIVELAAPVYEPPRLGLYVKEWRTRFALHMPVATTSVEELRTTWGPKLKKARAALGLRQGRQPGRIAAITQIHSLTGETWEKIAEMDAPKFPPSEYDLMSQASRYRRKARESAQERLYIKGGPQHEPDSVVDRGLSKLRERAQSEIERGRAGFRQGKIVYPEDGDLVHMTVTFGNS